MTIKINAVAELETNTYGPDCPKNYPEKMRVRFSVWQWIVQTYSVKQGRWITQKGHALKQAALDDMNGWYPA